MLVVLYNLDRAEQEDSSDEESDEEEFVAAELDDDDDVIDEEGEQYLEKLGRIVSHPSKVRINFVQARE